ncbi:MAG: hypothetical protein H6705_16770 [Myxococcales bacterium]|nr:hypothetical protein [Myxococcales bacterium]
MGLPLRATTRDTADVVLTFDESIKAAWSEEERARYLLLGEMPKSGVPRDATIFRIRPMRWAERRAARDASANGHHSARGFELLGQYIEAMSKAGAAKRDIRGAGDRFRRRLSLADRRELDGASITQLHHDEALCEQCVVEVIESGRREPWAEVVDQLDGALVSQAISELAQHIARISRLSPSQAF